MYDKLNSQSEPVVLELEDTSGTYNKRIIPYLLIKFVFCRRQSPGR